MNIEEYNLDSLRKLVRDLQKENKELPKELYCFIILTLHWINIIKNHIF